MAEDFEPDAARRALFFIAFSPYAIFFFLGYAESLFLLLSIGIFLLLRRGKPLDWWLAGLLGFLAMLTRSTGLILVIPYLVVYTQRFWSASEAKQVYETLFITALKRLLTHYSSYRASTHITLSFDSQTYI